MVTVAEVLSRAGINISPSPKCDSGLIPLAEYSLKPACKLPCHNLSDQEASQLLSDLKSHLLTPAIPETFCNLCDHDITPGNKAKKLLKSLGNDLTNRGDIVKK